MKNKLTAQLGFTLLDVMISIAMLAIVVAVIGGALRLTHRSIDNGEQKIEATERLRNALSLIDAQIQSSIPVTLGEGPDKKFFFEGDKGSLQFVSTISFWGNRKGPVIVKYKLEQKDEGVKVLHVSERTIGVENNRESIFLNGIDDLSFEYYCRKPLEEDGSWTDAWEEADTIPEKIRIRAIKGRNERAYVFPIRIGAKLSQGAVVYAIKSIDGASGL